MTRRVGRPISTGVAKLRAAVATIQAVYPDVWDVPSWDDSTIWHDRPIPDPAAYDAAITLIAVLAEALNLTPRTFLECHGLVALAPLPLTPGVPS